MTDRPPTPTLAEALAKMGREINDNAGQMLHGHRWPEVKAELEAKAELAATLQRRARIARLVAYALLLVFLAALAPAVVVMAWRVAL